MIDRGSGPVIVMIPGIQGRWDDMKLIRGTNIYPRAVESIVRECAAVTVQSASSSNCSIGRPTIWLRPSTTARAPSVGGDRASALGCLEQVTAGAGVGVAVGAGLLDAQPAAAVGVRAGEDGAGLVGHARALPERPDRLRAA